MVSRALRVLLRTFVQAGHIKVGASVELDFECGESLLVVNLTETRVLRERGWVFISDEAGQIGLSLKGLDGE